MAYGLKASSCHPLKWLMIQQLHPVTVYLAYIATSVWNNSSDDALAVYHNRNGEIKILKGIQKYVHGPKNMNTPWKEKH